MQNDSDYIIENKTEAATKNLFLSDNRTIEQARSVYAQLYRQVIEAVDCKEGEVRNTLFKQSGLAKKIKKLVGQNKSCPGMVLGYGTKNEVEIVVCGNQQEYALSAQGTLVSSCEKMTKNSIFDLASVTKFFTCLTLFKLSENNLIDFQEPISKYDARFKNIGHLTVKDLMGFQRKLVTSERVDQILNPEVAESVLFKIREQKSDLRPYSDMGAMVLKYIVEAITKKHFFDVVRDYILIPNNMKHTNIAYQEKDLKNLVCNNFEVRLMHDESFLDTYASKGVVHDKKARIFGRGGAVLSGHAGLFSTVMDMNILLQNVLSGKVINKDNLLRMSENQIGFQNKNGEYSQYLGMLCHTKHPKTAQSEVYRNLSDAAFALGGYTGSYFSIDPLNNVFVFMGSNRCHHRLTSIQDCSDSFVARQKSVYPESSDFAWERDEVCHCALNLALQYKFLEDLDYKETESMQRVYSL